MRGATLQQQRAPQCQKISIHAPHAGRDDDVRVRRTPHRISIHAPHAGRDQLRQEAALVLLYFNPRAPCGARPTFAFTPGSVDLFQSTRPMRGATFAGHGLKVTVRIFQSTRPMRGATSSGRIFLIRELFQSTRPMRGATFPSSVAYAWVAISIHAPHAGRDGITGSPALHAAGFQSTRPMRGATHQNRHKNQCQNHFNPRAPCGARLQTLSHNRCPY